MKNEADRRLEFARRYGARKPHSVKPLEIITRTAAHFAAAKPIQLTTACRMTLRMAAAGQRSDNLKIVGCPVPYDRLSCDLGGFREVYQRGCFSDSLANDDLRALLNHDSGRVLGRKSAGTAMFYETPAGLYCEVDPPDCTWANDLIVSMDRGDIDGMSAAFYITGYRWESRSGERVRVVEKGILRETSVVSFPAYEATHAAVSRPGQDQALAAGSFYLSPSTQKGIVLQ